MPSSKITATVITLNEERNIGRCLDSLAPVADEIIVVDSFSSDNTKGIAQAKGAKFFEQEWKGYGTTKNYAASLGENEYILSIDADEALSQELKNSILEAKKNGLKGVYQFNRLTNYCGHWIKHCGWYPDTKIRLYAKENAEWSSDIIHEEIILKNSPSITFLKGDLHHYSYYSQEEHQKKARKYAELGAQRDIHRKNNFLRFRSVFGALLKFIKMYFFQMGFLDGRAGFIICRMSAWAVYVKYRQKEKLK